MVFLLFIFLLVIYLIYYYTVLFRKTGRLINLIPGPPGFPIVGHLFAYRGSTENIWYILRDINLKNYPIYRLWLLHRPIVRIFHPKDLEIILSSAKYIEKGLIYAMFYPWFSTGLLTSGGTKWHTRRRLLTPAFHFNILQQYVEVLIEESRRMTETLKDVKEPVTKDLVSFISEHSLNAICETAMGVSLKDKTLFQRKYHQAIYEITQILVLRLTKPWMTPEMVFKLSWSHIKQYRLLKILKDFTKKVIAERKQSYKDGNISKILSNDVDNAELTSRKKRRLAMLDLLLEASQEGLIDDAGIEEEVDTFMYEGHDTVAMGTCFALAALAEYKDIQNRVREEIDIALKENDRKFTMSFLQNLPYLERVLKESLRLYPSVPIIAREMTQNIQLSSYTVPPGTIVEIHIYDIHRDPNFWPNSEVFDPDRFLPENLQNHHPYSYIPFSAGPRNCIGQRFAMLEMKAIVASLLHSFYLEPVDSLQDVRYKIDLVLRPAQQLRVKFIPIN